MCNKWTTITNIHTEHTHSLSEWVEIVRERELIEWTRYARKDKWKTLSVVERSERALLASLLIRCVRECLLSIKLFVREKVWMGIRETPVWTRAHETGIFVWQRMICCVCKKDNARKEREKEKEDTIIFNTMVEWIECNWFNWSVLCIYSLICAIGNGRFLIDWRCKMV